MDEIISSLNDSGFHQDHPSLHINNHTWFAIKVVGNILHRVSQKSLLPPAHTLQSPLIVQLADLHKPTINCEHIPLPRVQKSHMMSQLPSVPKHTSVHPHTKLRLCQDSQPCVGFRNQILFQRLLHI